MKAEYIKQIFIDYLNIEKTQYGILLNGNWGCGKTFFWKNTLDKTAQENGFKTIYVSLNGISKIEDLDQQLFIKLLPFISNQENKVVQNTTKFVGNLLNKISSHYLKSSLSDIFKGVSIDAFNFSNYLICFDDLERCQISVKEVLGFINGLVEHKSLKTIILVNEAEITDSKDYQRIKEKVIGRDLKYELDIESILPNLFNKYEDKIEFYKFLNKNKNNILDILVDYKQDNLRIIVFYLDILERIFPGLKNVEYKYIYEVILFTAIIVIEFKLGELSSVDYTNFKQIDEIDEHYYSLYIARTTNVLNDKEKDIIKSYPVLFYERYLTERIKSYHFYASIYSYILSGYFDLIKFDSEIRKRQPEQISKEVKDFRTLFNYKFRELSNSDFKKLTEEVLVYAKEGKYFIYDYIQIANFFYFFCNNKLITESKEEIDKVIFEGLEISKERKQINTKFFANIMHFQTDNLDTEIIRNHVKEIHNTIMKNQNIVNSNKLIKYLLDENEEALKGFFDEYKFNKEVFQYIDDKSFIEVLFKVSNKQISCFTELLINRYSSSNIGEFLYEDVVFLLKIQNKISMCLNGNIQCIQKFLLTTLVVELGQIIEKLNNTKKLN